MEEKNSPKQSSDNLDNILNEYSNPNTKNDAPNNISIEKSNIIGNYSDNKPQTDIDINTKKLQSAYKYYSATAEHREKSALNKPVMVLSIIMFIIVALLALYCMFYDALNVPQSMKDMAINDINQSEVQDDGYSREDTDNSNKPTVIIVPENKPNVSPNLKDEETGRYTTEGVAEAVRPSIVEIFNYEAGNKITPVGSGSGVIISTDGYIVTNAHVLEGASSLSVILSDGTEYDAKIIGMDSKTDIAVIKIEAAGLTNAIIGNSDEVKLGEQVMTIGNPGGLTGSITGGVVSGLNRLIKTGQTGYEMNCIQTDAAISPGNSGGALVNMYGQVIGITSSKYVNATDSSYEGLGFAITINQAKPIIEELIASGYITGRIKVGIVFYSINEYLSEVNDYPVGILITDIDENCDVYNTDLDIEDIITKVEGVTVYDYDSLMNALQYKSPGDAVTATVVRIDNQTGEQTTFEISFKLMEENPTT